MASQNPLPRDTGYAWVILAAAFMMYFLKSGLFTTFGLFLVEFMEEFQATKSELTLVGTMQMFVGSILGLLTGHLIKWFDCRSVAIAGSVMIAFSFMITAFSAKFWAIYMFYGVLAGTGSVFVKISAMVIVQQYFHKKRALASGILSMGICAGVFCWPPLTRWLIDQYSWRGAMMIEAGIYLNIAVFGSLMRPRTGTSKFQETTVREGNQQPRKSFLIRHLHFIVFSIGIFGTYAGHMFVITYSPMKADILGISKSNAALVISIIGIVGLLPRVVFGYMGDRKWNNRTVMYGMCVTSVGAMTVISSQFRTFPLLVFHAVFFGTISAGYMAVTGAVIVDTVGLQRVEVSSAILNAVMGSAHIILHSGTGAIMDTTGDINMAAVLIGVIQTLGGLLVVSVPWIQRNIRDKYENNTDVEMSDVSETTKHNGL